MRSHKYYTYLQTLGNSERVHGSTCEVKHYDLSFLKMSAPPRSKITMQTWIATAANKPAESPNFDRSLTYLF